MPPTTPERSSAAAAEDASRRLLQLSVPVRVFRGFADCAGRLYDYSGGARRTLFLNCWEAYREASDEERALDRAFDWEDIVGDRPLRSLHFMLQNDVFRDFVSTSERTFDYLANARSQLFVRVWFWRCVREGWQAER